MAAILFSLFNALLHLIKGDSSNKKNVRALSWRIGLSTLLFVLLIALNYFGIVRFHTLPQIDNQQTTQQNK